MYQWLYSDNPYRHYPLFAMMVFLVFFAGTLAWAYWPRRAARFDEAARLPLEDGQ
jgi:cbb3-type cytochrome oxidase subunit 3